MKLIIVMFLSKRHDLTRHCKSNHKNKKGLNTFIKLLVPFDKRPICTTTVKFMAIIRPSLEPKAH